MCENAEEIVQPKNKVDAFFGITARGSSFKTEIFAGITTFMAMAYILMVNAGMFQSVIGGDDPYGAAYIATALGAIAGTLLMAFLAKMPLAQASGMGVNALIVYTLILGGTGLTYANTMVFVLLDGLIFVVLTATGLRKKIFTAIPDAVKVAIPVGIGLFIAYIGFQDANVIVASSTISSLKSFNILSGANAFAVYTDGTVTGLLPAVVCILGVIIIAVLSKKNVKGAILWGILGSAVLYYIFAGIGAACGSQGCIDIFANISFSNPFTAFGAWGKNSVGQVFAKGFDFSAYLGVGDNNVGTLIVLLLTTALSLCMIDMFDTLGTLYGACSKGNLLDENGNPVNMEKSMLSDSIATCIGAVCGTSTVTTFVECSSGVSAGGRTGFTALVTAACFFVAMFLSPIAQLIPSASCGAALVYVGVLMMTGVTKVEWSDPACAVPAFLAIAVMGFGYSISFGIGIGLISYVLVTIFTGKIKTISVATWVITVLFVLMFVLTN